MNHLDIEASLRKVNQKFVDQLTNQEKKKAIKQFRKAYAEQIAKLTYEVSKRIKVQENLDHINKQEMNQVKQIDQQLRKKMEKHLSNRQKLQQSKQKEYKLLEQNWRRRLDEMKSKNRQKQRQAFDKAQKIRKQAEQFWIKKQNTVSTRQDLIKTQQKSRVSKHQNSNDKEKKRNLSFGTEYPTKKNQFQLPIVKNKIKRNTIDKNLTLNQSLPIKNIDEDIRYHQQKSIKTAKEQEEENFQKILEKLHKIQKTRNNVKERIQKQVQQARKIREFKQNPETIAANRKKFMQQQLKSEKANLKHKRQLKVEHSLSPAGSKSNLDNSIISRLETHKRIKEDEFQKREESYELKQKKIKNTQINRMIKDAIKMLKHQALYE